VAGRSFFRRARVRGGALASGKQPSDPLDGLIGALGAEPAVERLPPRIEASPAVDRLGHLDLESSTMMDRSQQTEL
jgi:hypothetical protein